MQSKKHILYTGELDRLNFNSTLKPGEFTQKNQGHVADRVLVQTVETLGVLR